MTQPQYAPPQGYAPPAPQQPYQPEQPYVPPQQTYPPQGYGQQAPQQPYGPQGYAPSAPQGYGPPPQQPLAAGTLDQFWSQPSAGGGAALKFEQIGAQHVGRVTRPIQDSDIQQQTVVGSNAPAFYKDGRPKFVMKVPLAVAPSPTHPDGLAQWFCSGQARDELVRAMNEAGAPTGPPEAGAVVSITWVGERSAGVGMNKAKVYQVHYQRPDGADRPAAPAPQPPVPSQADQHWQDSPDWNTSAPQPPAQPPAAPPAQPPAPPAAAPEGLSTEQAQLLARLTGGQSTPAQG